MKIQPNYINPSYSKPAFRASFSNDPETKESLKNIADTGNDSHLYIYALIKDLEKVDSDDTISLKSEKFKNGNELHTVTNTRTQESIWIRIEKKDNERYKSELCCNNMYYGDEIADTNDQYLGSLIYKGILSDNGLEALFGIKKSKSTPISEIEPSDFKSLRSIADTKDIDSEISRLKNIREKMEDKIENLRKGQRFYNGRIRKLKADRKKKTVEYVKSQIDAIA